MAKEEKSDQSLFLKTEQFIRENGYKMRTRKMEEESRSGQTGLDTMVSGRTEWRTGTGDWCTRKETFTRESGRRTRPTGTEFTLISMAVDTKASGITINNMDSEWSSGLMEPSTKDSMNRA